MATRESIEMDFKNAMSQADKVDGIANRLARLSNNQFQSTLQNVNVGWKGDNANLYLQKGAKLKTKMNASAEDLHDVASDIRSAARRIYNAEMMALSIATGRTY